MRPAEFDRLVISARQGLMGFAYKLCRNRERAEDLVQTTMLRAMRKHESFEMGTSIKAWLFTILRNEFLSQCRTGGREVGDPDSIFASLVAMPGDQEDAYDLKIVLGQMELLSPKQRASLELVGMDQLSYEEAADELGVAVGTVKSLVSRARETLREVLDGRREALRR